RVMSGMTTATRSDAFTVSRSGLPPSGWRTASSNDRPSSGSPSTNVGSMTRAFAEGRSMESPSFPYCRCTFMDARGASSPVALDLLRRLAQRLLSRLPLHRAALAGLGGLHQTQRLGDRTTQGVTVVLRADDVAVVVDDERGALGLPVRLE